MKRGLLMLSLLSIFSLSAQATLIETHQGLELRASMVVLPSNDNGNISVRACDDCDRLSLKTDSGVTRYVIRNTDGSKNTVALDEFATEMRLIDNRDAMVLVFYETESLIVTKAELISKSNSGTNSGSARATQQDTSAAQRSW